MSFRFDRPSVFAFGSLCLLGLIAFWPSVWFDFVNWDDPAYVQHNELIKSWSPSNLVGVATETVTRNYAPLTIASLLLDHTIWGMNPSGYHATNVLLHVLNGLLVFVLLRQLTGSSFIAWFTAALFLVHPVQIETVAWISSRKGLLSATFMLAALIVRLKPEPEAKDDAWYVIWLAAALLSKALAVVLPAIVLCYDLWIRRQKFADAFSRQIIPGVMCLLLLFKTMASQHSVMGGVRGHLDYSIWHIVAIDATILWRYIGMLLYPNDLSVLYDPPTIGIWKIVVAASVAWILVATVIWRLRQRYPLLIFAAATALLLLFPVLNFFKITTLMNDRYLYLPCIVLFAMVGGILRSAFLVGSAVNNDSGQTLAVLRPVAASLQWSIALCAVLGALVLTSVHLPVWTNAQTLWTHAMTTVPQIPVVRIQMAFTLHDMGQRREAIRVLQRALLQTEPDELDRKRITGLITEWDSEIRNQTAAGTSDGSVLQ